MSYDLSPRVTRRAALLGFAALAGCGFRPVYGTGGVAQGFRNTVAIDAPDSVDGYEIQQQLENRLGHADQATYQLTITLNLGAEAVAIASDETATRVNLPGTASFSLADATGLVTAQGEVSSFTSYSTTSTTVATRAAEADARRRLMSILADMIVTRIMAAAATGG